VTGQTPFAARVGVEVGAPHADIRLDWNAQHDVLGQGLRVVLELPVVLGAHHAHRLAQKINLHDVGNVQGPPMFGGWSLTAAAIRLQFISFVPAAAARLDIGKALTHWAVERSQWAAEWIRPSA
jgi:hypothetical protein